MPTVYNQLKKKKNRKYPVTTKAEVNQVEKFGVLDKLLISLISGVLHVLKANVFGDRLVLIDVRRDHSSTCENCPHIHHCPESALVYYVYTNVYPMCINVSPMRHAAGAASFLQGRQDRNIGHAVCLSLQKSEHRDVVLFCLTCLCQA